MSLKYNSNAKCNLHLFDTELFKSTPMQQANKTHLTPKNKLYIMANKIDLFPAQRYDSKIM